MLTLFCTQYIIMNLAISSGFGYVDFERLTFPSSLKIDYLRLYQAKGKENVGCDRARRRVLSLGGVFWSANPRCRPLCSQKLSNKGVH